MGIKVAPRPLEPPDEQAAITYGLRTTPCVVQTRQSDKEVKMASPILGVLEAEVARATTVMASAVTLIDGIAARVQAAIDKALEAGATAEQLAGLQDEVDAIAAASTALAAAVEANTVA